LTFTSKKLTVKFGPGAEKSDILYFGEITTSVISNQPSDKLV